MLSKPIPLSADVCAATSVNPEEEQYLALVRRILTEGERRDGRNGDTQSVFFANMRFSLEDGALPLLTTKRVAWKTCLKELLWFMRGDTDVRYLQAEGVHIWDGNSTRDFLDQRGLSHLREHLIGPGYGFQWRHFGAAYNVDDGSVLHSGAVDAVGVDQLQWIVDQLRNPATRHSRRLVMSAWNPAALNEMALPPCHVLCQFHVSGADRLSCVMFQRSCDVALGLPFNIASYAFLTHLLAHHCGLQAHELCISLGDCHVYAPHLEPMRTQLKRAPFAFPSIVIRPVDARLHIDAYQVEDVQVEDYTSHPSIPMDMVA